MGGNETDENTITASLNTDNYGYDLYYPLPERIAIFDGEVSDKKVKTVNGQASSNYEGKSDSNVIVTIDNQNLTVPMSGVVAATLYVNYTGGKNSNDGKSWENALKTLEYAVSIASYDTTIYVANGTTVLSSDISTNKNIYIYGQSSDGTLIDVNNHQISFNSVYESSINHLTIKNAQLINNPLISNKGILMIDDVIFTKNTLTNALLIDNENQIIIKNSKFNKNNAASILLTTGNTIILNSEFIMNTASSNGGIINNQQGNLTVQNSCFTGNNLSGGSYGGVIYNWYGNAYISQSSFENNENSAEGGIIYSKSSELVINSSKFVSNNLSYNVISLDDVAGSINYSLFVSNNADNMIDAVSSIMDIENNWWGNNQNNTKFDTSLLNGLDAPKEWLILNISRTSDKIYPEDNELIVLDLTKTQSLNQINSTLIPNIEFDIAVENGQVDKTSINLENGYGEITYTAGETGQTSISAVVGNYADTLIFNVDFYPSIVYVATNGSDENGGTSWEDAFESLSKAISVMTYKKKTLYIGEGEYNASDLRITSSYTIQGFGDVVLNANGNSSIFYIPSSKANILIRNITFTGVVSSNYASSAIVLAEKSNLTVENCIFENNTYSSQYSVGSAISQGYDNTLVVINNTIFRNNSAGISGAINHVHGDMIIDNCLFEKNSAASGSIIRDLSGDLIIINSQFYENSAINLILLNNGVTSTINYNIFEENNVDYIIENKSTSINADYNYFGTNSNPSSLNNNLNLDNWIILDSTLSKPIIFEGDVITLTIDFTKYMDVESNVKTLTNYMPNINITLSPTIGSLSKTELSLSNGKASTTYSATTEGSEIINVFTPYPVDNIEFNIFDKSENTIYVSNTGNDNTGDGSEFNPYASIKKALERNDKLGGNKTIYILNGSYTTDSLVINNDVTILGESEDNVVIKSFEGTIFINNANLLVYGIKLSGSETAFINNKSLDVQSVIFDSNDIAIISNNKLSVKDSTFYNCDVGIQNTKGNVSIARSLFENNTKNSIDLSNTNAILSDNTLINSALISIDETSTINDMSIIFIENKSIESVYGKNAILNATVRDIDGNLINGGIITFYLNNSKIGTSKVFDGIATIEYSPEIGNYLVNGTYSGCENPTVETGTLNIYTYYWFIGDEGYRTLQDAVNAAKSGDIIEGVENTYSYTNFINVNKNVTIQPKDNGNVIIDGSKTSYYVMSLHEGCNITLNNLTFINARHLGDAGAIYNHATLYVNNCTFEANRVYDFDSGIHNRGGAIFTYDGNITVKDSTFINNVAPEGGAIYIGGTATAVIDNCIFLSNYATLADDAGGAIYNTGNMLVNNTLFDSNMAIAQGSTGAGVGGAIVTKNNDNTIIANSNFTNNAALYWAGAIKNYKGLEKLVNCLFVGNYANYGGALQGAFPYVENCTFVNNTAGTRGGAVEFEGASNILNSTFVGNNAPNGGGLYAGFSLSLTTVDNCIFINNNATYGGGVENYHDILQLSNSIFINNTATYGGAFYNEESYTEKDVVLDGNVFINNTATAGGAIYSEGLNVTDNNFTILSSLFVGNAADSANAIYLNDNADLRYNAFLNGETDVIGANINSRQYITANYNWWGTNSPVFSKLLSYIQMPSIRAVLILNANPDLVSARQKSTINGSFVWSNDLSSNNTDLIPARTLILNSSGGKLDYETLEFIGNAQTTFSSTIEDTYFITGTVDNQSVTIKVVVGELVLLDDIYVDWENGDDLNSGENWTNAVKTIEEALLLVSENGNIHLANGTTYKSSADPITIDKSVNIIAEANSMIDGNSTQIFSIKNGTVSMNSITFINGYSKNYGGAISNEATLTLTDVKFINNTASGSGAIDNSGNLTILNALFENNSAYKRDGGAISNLATLNIINSTFINNTAGRNGGAIKNQGDKLTVENSIFDSNQAIGEDNFGGAIYTWASTTEISNSKFINNSASTFGGALFVSGGNSTANLTVSQSIFENNSAQTGDSVYATRANVTINYSKVLDNLVFVHNTDENIDYNWWGENNPDWSEVLTNSSAPNVFAVLNVTTDDKTVDVNLYWNGTVNQENIDKIPDISGSIEVTSGDVKESEFVFDNGKYEFDVDGADYNTIVTVKVGNEVQNVTINTLIKTVLNASDIVMYYSGGTRYVVVLTDIDGNPLANQLITIILNGVSYNRTTNENGSVSIGLNLNSGQYNVSAIYISQLENYLDSNITNTITVLSTIEGNDLVKVFRNATQYYAKFVDFNGTPLVNAVVSFNINGVFYNRTTNASGIAKLNINLPQGEYILTAINPATNEMYTNIVKVIPTITENTNLVKYYRNASQYVVRLIGSDGNPVGAGEIVTFNINGVFYNRTTNASGHAKLNINLHPGDYIITAEYNGCRESNNIKVLPLLSAKDMTMSYMDGSQFEAKLVDGQGKPYSGQSITFNINGVFYQRTTDIDGIARLNIRLMSGQYIITSSYNGANIANKITIH